MISSATSTTKNIVQLPEASEQTASIISSITAHRAKKAPGDVMSNTSMTVAMVAINSQPPANNPAEIASKAVPNPKRD